MPYKGNKSGDANFHGGQIKLGGICLAGKKVAADQNIQLERTFDGAACAMCLTLKYF